MHPRHTIRVTSKARWPLQGQAHMRVKSGRLGGRPSIHTRNDETRQRARTAESVKIDHSALRRRRMRWRRGVFFGVGVNHGAVTGFVIVMGRRTVVVVVMTVMIFIILTTESRDHPFGALDVVVRTP